MRYGTSHSCGALRGGVEDDGDNELNYRGQAGGDGDEGAVGIGGHGWGVACQYKRRRFITGQFINRE